MPAPRPLGVLARAGQTAYLLGLNQVERTKPWWPRERLERLQQSRVRAAVEHAYTHVPFYRRALDDLGAGPADFTSVRDLERLPLITGRDLAANPDDLTATPFRHTGREVFSTSGSTSGVRKRICWDHPSLMRRFARGERDRTVIVGLAGERWAGNMLRELTTREAQRTIAARLARVDATAHQRLQILPAGFSSRTMRAIGEERSLVPRRPLHYHHLSPLAPFEVAAAQIRALKPRVIYSFGSYVEQFLRELVDRGESVPMPRVWVYLGDMISPAGWELAAELGCRLYSVYGAMEMGTIGFQCERRDGFHLNVDLCALRVVDGEGRTLPDGEVGDIVVSSLENRATVLLNYSIGDRGVIDPRPCPCGRTLPVLASFAGRSSETIALPDGRRLSSLVLEGLFRTELRSTLRAQLQQVEPGRISWRIVPFRSVDPDELRRAFVARAAQCLGSDVQLTVQIEEQIATTKEGKLVRAVVRPSGDVPTAPEDGVRTSDAVRAGNA
jgi:phenylacetate-CoA ligase